MNQMKLTMACISMALLTSMAIHAQKNLPSNIHFRTLANGLEILVVEDLSVPLVTIEFAVKNGAFTETDEFDGLSHLYEHMFFKANKDYPSQEAYLKKVNELGIEFNGTTGNERVNYYITLSSKKMNEGLEFMNTAMRYPLFLEEEMKKENPVVDGEFQRLESDPTYYLMRDAGRKLWKTNYSRKNAIGNHSVILKATPAQMRTIQERYYYPNNTLLIIAGAVKADEAFASAERIFSSWAKSKFDIFEKYPVPRMEGLTRSESFITMNDNAQVPIMLISLHGPSAVLDEKSTYAADVFHAILQQESGRLQQNLVQSGLAYQVGTGYQTEKYTGPIQIFLVPNPTKVSDAIATLEREIALWDSPDYFTDAQLENAKNQIVIQDEYARENTSEYAHLLSYWWASASLDYYVNYSRNIKAVTREDIADYVRKYIKGRPNVTGILLSPALQGMTGITTIEPLKL